MRVGLAQVVAGTAAGSPSAATVISAAGNRNIANATSATSTRPSPIRNAMRDRRGRCGNSELAMDGGSRCSPGAAPKARIRSQSGPFPRRSIR